MDIETFKQNFGGYLLALVVVLLMYSAVSMVAPQYANGFAMITLLGIAMFYVKKGSG